MDFGAKSQVHEASLTLNVRGNILMDGHGEQVQARRLSLDLLRESLDEMGWWNKRPRGSNTAVRAINSLLGSAEATIDQVPRQSVSGRAQVFSPEYYVKALQESVIQLQADDDDCRTDLLENDCLPCVSSDCGLLDWCEAFPQENKDDPTLRSLFTLESTIIRPPGRGRTSRANWLEWLCFAHAARMRLIARDRVSLTREDALLSGTLRSACKLLYNRYLMLVEAILVWQVQLRDGELKR